MECLTRHSRREVLLCNVCCSDREIGWGYLGTNSQIDFILAKGSALCCVQAVYLLHSSVQPEDLHCRSSQSLSAGICLSSGALQLLPRVIPHCTVPSFKRYKVFLGQFFSHRWRCKCGWLKRTRWFFSLVSWPSFLLPVLPRTWYLAVYHRLALNHKTEVSQRQSLQC